MKRILLGLLLSVFVFSLQAQVKLGAKLGGNLSNINEKLNIFGFENKPSFHAGGFAQFSFSEGFLFQGELLYSRKGASFKDDFSSFSNEEINYTLSYLNIPLLVGFKPVENFSILLGPEIGYLLNARIKNKNVNNDLNKLFDLNDFDLGIALGVDYQLENGIGFGVRYIHGITKAEDSKVRFTDPSGINLSSDNYWKNRTLQLYISYAFLR